MDMMSRQSVLVVEDEEDIMEVIRFNLEKEGYEVNQALSCLLYTSDAADE